MRATVITLPIRYGPERLKKFKTAWAKNGCSMPLDIHEGVTRAAPSLGCFQSHFDVWRASTEPIVVFEDDAIFAPEFTTDIVYPKDADIFFFGGEHSQPPIPVSDGIVKVTFIHHTHAYVVFDPQGLAGKVGDTVKGNIISFLNHRRLTMYAASPFTVGQAAGPSFIQIRPRPQDEFWND